jgi:sporulation protein YhbH
MTGNGTSPADRTRCTIRKVEADHARFREIVRGQIRKDLRKYVTRGEMIGRHGRYAVSIPLRQIRLPMFRFGRHQRGGVGAGDGEIGTPVAEGDPGAGAGSAGDQPGRHMLEVEVSLEELAQILGEELQLPRIRPKGKSTIMAERWRYVGISRAGPESLRHFKRTYKQALRRQLAMGLYDADDPAIIPIRDDKRYRTYKVRELPENNAVVIYMMDVSGSMGDEQKEIVRTEAFWIDTWLRSQYKKLETRYIVHDAVAREVDRETFYHVKESGGTKISSAYELCATLIDEHYDPENWNIYPFHFSDGDNWGSEDTRRCIAILRERLLPRVNQFSYGQVKSAYGSGQFKKDLDEAFSNGEPVVTSEIRDRDAIYHSIREFLGAGR